MATYCSVSLYLSVYYRTPYPLSRGSLYTYTYTQVRVTFILLIYHIYLNLNDAEKIYMTSKCILHNLPALVLKAYHLTLILLILGPIYQSVPYDRTVQLGAITSQLDARLHL